jgi:hypothetical protein
MDLERRGDSLPGHTPKSISLLYGVCQGISGMLEFGSWGQRDGCPTTGILIPTHADDETVVMDGAPERLG